MEINKNNYEAFFLDYHEGNLTAEEVAALLLFVEQHPELKEEFESFENITLDNQSSVVFSDKNMLKKEITTANKEQYFIGSIENTLNDSEKQLLADFIAQQPSAMAELELFKKTVFIADSSVAFENKDTLKKDISLQTGLTEQEHLLISATENVLSSEEKKTIALLLAGNIDIKKHLSLYQQTKLTADTSILFEGKEKLKRKSKKVIPLYYYVAAAASVLLLTGFFFLYKTSVPKDIVEIPSNHTQPEKQALKQTAELPLAPIQQTEQIKELKKITTKKEKNTVIPDVIVSHNALDIVKKSATDTTVIAKTNSEIPVIVSQIPDSDLAAEKQISPQSDLVKLQKQPAQVNEYNTLRELAAEKIKEKLLDENTIAIQKKTGQTKKINGWDIAQMVTKGISKLSGRPLELKPKYSEDGNITSYAFSAGEFKISKKL